MTFSPKTSHWECDRKVWFFLVRQLNKSGWYNYFLLPFFFFLYTARDSLGKFQAPSFFGLCAPSFPKTVPTFQAFTMHLHNLPLFQRLHLSDPKDASGQGPEECPLCYFPQRVTAQQVLHRKEPSSTFLVCSPQHIVGALRVWHNTGAQTSRDGDPGSSDIVSLICTNCMSWLQNFGIFIFYQLFSLFFYSFCNLS